MSTANGKTAWEQTPIGLLVPARAAVTARAPRQMASAAAGLSGRPTYAPVAADGYLSMPFNASLFRQFYLAIPALRRCVSVLAQFVGVPEFATGSERLDAALSSWAETVPVGYIGRGLATWLPDHLAQALVYGYAVGEMEIGRARGGITRLWSYDSSQFQFRSTPQGELTVVQQAGMRGLTALNPLTVLSTTYDPLGSDPRGQSLFLSIPTVAQVWMDMLYAVRQTCRRMGIQTFHINWEPPDSLDDPTGEVTASVRSALQTAWNAAMKSQVVDGIAYDFFTTGKITVQPVGGLSELSGIQENKRSIVEEIVVATGIPPWLLGYSWSTTERLSQQQADMLVAVIEALRRCVESVLLKMASLQLQLLGRREAPALVWPDVNLQDAAEQAKAALADASAMEARERVYAALWRTGVVDQAGYAEGVTGAPEVATPMDAPPALPQPPAPGEDPAEEEPDEDPEGEDAARSEAASEYPGHFRHRCAGAKAGADDPLQLYPTERPRYPSLRRELDRAWGAVSEAFLSLRQDWLAAAGLEEAPGKRAGGRAREKRELSPRQAAALDEAIETFLRQMAGADRSPGGFADSDTEDGALQQLEVLAHRTGVERAVALTRASVAASGPLTGEIRRRLLGEAFGRLTDGSRLRFETRLSEIRTAMEAGLTRGDSPTEIARRLSRDLDGYWSGRLRTIVRTEMGLASEAGIRDELRAQGATRVEVIGDPGTDALCTEHIGQIYDLGDLDNLPIYHPQCLCSVVPVTESGE